MMLYIDFGKPKSPVPNEMNHPNQTHGTCYFNILRIGNLQMSFHFGSNRMLYNSIKVYNPNFIIQSLGPGALSILPRYLAAVNSSPLAQKALLKFAWIFYV